MLHYQLNKKIFNEPIRLSEDEKKNPILVIDEFFQNYNLCEVREINQQMDHVCLSTDTPPYDDPDERAGLLSYRENEEKVMEAAYLLSQHNRSLPGNRQPQHPEPGENSRLPFESGGPPSSPKPTFPPPTGRSPKLQALLRAIFEAQMDVAILSIKIYPAWAQNLRAEIEQLPPLPQQNQSNEPPKEILDINELNQSVIKLRDKLTKLRVIALELSDTPEHV